MQNLGFYLLDGDDLIEVQAMLQNSFRRQWFKGLTGLVANGDPAFSVGEKAMLERMASCLFFAHAHFRQTESGTEIIGAERKVRQAARSEATYKYRPRQEIN